MLFRSVRSIPFVCRLVDRVPKDVNQIKLSMVGISRTTVKNSLIVLPFDILAINTPTNGDQDIHQAQ